jgi:hypothetical protein
MPKQAPQQVELTMTCDEPAEVVFFDQAIGQEKAYGPTPIVATAFTGEHATSLTLLPSPPSAASYSERHFLPSIISTFLVFTVTDTMLFSLTN